MREFRRWLCLLFVVATALSGGPHHHAREEIASMLRPEKGCGDACAHYAGHEAPDLAQFDRDCAACQHQAQSWDLDRSCVLFFQHLRSDRPEASSRLTAIRPVRRSSSRAPPRSLA